jgi:predicted enzyme related to lactoylglutathione lyase
MTERDPTITRHQALSVAALAFAGCVMPLVTGGPNTGTRNSDEPSIDDTTTGKRDEEQGSAMKIHYLEIVTKDVEAICAFYSKSLGVTFGEPDTSLGNARTAGLASGGMLGVRAPMHAGERAVVRPYMLVEDIEASVEAAKNSGAEVMVPPMKLGEHGTCAIVYQSGLEAGFWQV